MLEHGRQQGLNARKTVSYNIEVVQKKRLNSFCGS